MDKKFVLIKRLEKEIDQMYPQVDSGSTSGRAFCDGYSNAMDDVRMLLSKTKKREVGLIG